MGALDKSLSENFFNPSDYKIVTDGEFSPVDDPEELFKYLEGKFKKAVRQSISQMSSYGKSGYEESFYVRQIIRSNFKEMDTSTLYMWIFYYMNLLYPEMSFNPWRQDMMYHWCKCWAEDYKEYSTHGASGCNKTSSMAMIAVAVWTIDPEYISIYVTSPYRQASESGIWSNITEQYEVLYEENTWIAKEVNSRHVETSHIIKLNDKRFPRGFIKIATVDQVGMMVGRKPKDVTRGGLFFIVDEAPEFKRRSKKSVLTLLQNLKSVDNMREIGRAHV